MPDLVGDGERIELPFWLDDLSTGRRQRLTINHASTGALLDFNRATLELSKASTADLAQFCITNKIRIAPRALTLTMFIRLFACDQWIHGIGGARYDRVTDQIIHDFFHIDPPTFGVTTATLFFPSAAMRQRTSLPAIEHAGHQLKHRVLGAAKAPYLEQIEHAPRPVTSIRRNLLHDASRPCTRPIRRNWPIGEQQWQQAQLAATEDRAVFDRELFYALQPRENV